MEISINNKKIQAEKGKTIIQIADENGIYIPRLCYHHFLANEKVLSTKQVFRNGMQIIGEENKEFDGCEICIVEVNKKFVKACSTLIEDGIEILTETEEIKKIREENLSKILAEHPHACLICSQREGCDRRTCTMSVLIEERCCDKFGNCELQKLAEYIGIKKDLQKYIYKKLPIIKELPLISIDYNLCINCLRCIKICNLREVNALSFTFKNGKVIFGTTSKELKDNCKFCLSCIEVCPTGSLVEKEKREIPCIVNCAAEIDVPNYISLIAEGNFSESLKVIKEKVPFPNVLGRVCYKPCEEHCKRGKLNESISICALKRFSGEYGDIPIENSKPNEKGKKVAIIGSGPSGLTAGYYLAKKGYSVFVYEKEKELGGMLRYGIPKYRLPNEVLEKDLKEIKNIGINFKTNTKINALQNLRGFDAILISIGAQSSVKLNIEGKELAIGGLQFLKEINKENKEFANKFKEKEVAIIGGGNVAFDCARVLLRLNGFPTIFYRRGREEILAYKEEVEEAEKEGVKIEFLTSPIKIQKNEKLKVEFIRMKLGEVENGRRKPIPIENSNFVLEFDFIISAIGQTIENDFGLKIKNENFSTNIKGIFACGDVLTPKTVIDAIAQGRKSAIAIDRFLGGDGNIDKIEKRERRAKIGREKKFYSLKRKNPCLNIKERISFKEVEKTYSKEEAIYEAKRCLKCDLRFEIPKQILPPEQFLILNEENLNAIPEAEGVFELIDENKEVILIHGVENLKNSLKENFGRAKYFRYEIAPYYTKRESEIIQQFLQKYGRMPKLNDDLNTLF